MQECRYESEIYNYWWIQLSNDELINEMLGVRSTWFDCNVLLFIQNNNIISLFLKYGFILLIF